MDNKRLDENLSGELVSSSNGGLVSKLNNNAWSLMSVRSSTYYLPLMASFSVINFSDNPTYIRWASNASFLVAIVCMCDFAYTVYRRYRQ